MASELRAPLHKKVSFTIDIAAAAYSQNDQVGTIQAVKISEVAARGVHIREVYLQDEDNNDADCELYIFNQSVTLAADNAAFTIADADAPYAVGRVVIAAANWTTGVATNYVWKRALNILAPTVNNYLYLGLKLTSVGGETASTASGISGYIVYDELFNFIK